MWEWGYGGRGYRRNTEQGLFREIVLIMTGSILQDTGEVVKTKYTRDDYVGGWHVPNVFRAEGKGSMT